MNITITKADNKDAETILQLLKALYLELGEESESIRFLTVSFLCQILHSGNTEIYLAKNKQEQNIGIITLTESQAIYAGGKFGSLDEMYIVPEFRSQNIGGMFIEFLKEIGRTKNWNRIDVTAPTEEKWQRTAQFYEKTGFVFTGPKLKLKL